MVDQDAALLSLSFVRRAASGDLELWHRSSDALVEALAESEANGTRLYTDALGGEVTALQAVGRMFADEAVAHMVRTGDVELLPRVAQTIVEQGRSGPVEAGFFDGIARHLTTKG
jgi:hypothetical protein